MRQNRLHNPIRAERGKVGSDCAAEQKIWKRTLYVTLLAQFMSCVGFSSTLPFLPLYVRQLGSVSSLGTDFLSGAVYSAPAMLMMFAAPFWGNLADRYGRKLMVERALFGGAFLTMKRLYIFMQLDSLCFYWLVENTHEF